jgi:energy-coupling factor transporter ATP-binding protein EcfA2
VKGGYVDFYRIRVQEKKDGSLHIRPDWIVGRSKDLMTRSGSFYAVWDEGNQTWSTEIYDLVGLVDAHLYQYKEEMEQKTGHIYKVDSMASHGSKVWDDFNRFLRNSGNNSYPLDASLVFENTIAKKEDYSSHRLPYSLHDGRTDSWDALVGTLYNEEERAKIEWAIGAVVSGESKRIQKFLVFYGPPGSGKSTILNIIERLFVGYTAVFDARELAGNNNSFATSAFKTNPLVAIQHDGDLSRIYDNTKLNSIVAHEILPVNEKYKAVVEMRSHAFLFMGTNVPVKITDAKSGIIRRLIDVVPTEQRIEHDTYHRLMDTVNFELGAIAKKCYDRFKSMGPNFYSNYRPTEMMLQTDVFYNFVESYFDIFKAEDGVTLKRAWTLYKQFCEETGIEKRLPQYKLREELKNYFVDFEDRAVVDGEKVRSYFRGFKHLEPMPPQVEMPIKPKGDYQIVLQEGIPSIFDEKYSSQPAQGPKADGTPKDYWANVKTTLADLDTSELHYVLVPENLIVIDFDLTDDNGEKSLELNLEAASRWPATYTETSKSGQGIHLHYFYYGDVSMLSTSYSDGIDILPLLGGSSLRRKLTRCNAADIATLDGATLPKKEKPMLAAKSIQSEKGLRKLIEQNLRKEHHPSTKSSVDFIHKILEDAYESGIPYDVRDLRATVQLFAARSTNQADTCIKLVQSMKFVSEAEMESEKDDTVQSLVFFDVEVYPNLFVVCWKYEDKDEVMSMINPTPQEIEKFLRMPIIGFNNRRYDNHILYARFMGYSIEELYNLSQKMIVQNNRDVMFGEAYNISFTDIYDFSSEKKSLKKFQIELGLWHLEIDIPWDEPVPESRWPEVVAYCKNDVTTTEAVFKSPKRQQDYVARRILADLSGLTVNHTTQNHTAKIIFGEDRNPQSQFVYTDLSDMFDGYSFDGKESTYRGEVVGEGGYVYAEPGIYENVALLDVASMHPTSIECLELFGPYTERFAALKEARMAIKAQDYESARNLLDGKLAPYLDDTNGSAQDLAYALKIVINIVYGLTAAKFDNKFRDIRNKDNIVAKRGALFMVDLKHFVQERGFQVVHIKTDSIKIPNATPEIIEAVTQYGKEWGYDFELEEIYKKLALVNDAVYIAEKQDGEWYAVGAQFQHPYVFKTMFSGEEVSFDDFCETKSVAKGAMYLDFQKTGSLGDMVFIGRTGSFVPVLSNDGADLYRVYEEKLYHVAGTKDWSWIDRDTAIQREKDGKLTIDSNYFLALVEAAREQIEKYGSFDDFVRKE